VSEEIRLTSEQRERYRRNLLLAGVDEAGQKKLLASRVLVVGAGGLGSAALLYLAAAGVCDLTVADGDRVDLTNLNRQILFGIPDLGRAKTDAAGERITALNPDCRLRLLSHRLTAATLPDALQNQDLVLDCTDNFSTRYILADACWTSRVPLLTAAVAGWQG
jgi:molybdopterin/thiamine biosynthesis adenylyltransferase